MGYDVVKYEPASFVLNNIYLRLYKNELKLADEIRSHIATTLTQFSENYLNDKDLEDFRNCFIGKYTPKEGDRNIFEYDDNLFLEVENEYEKITDEIILGVKTKYFTQFCTAISESRTQIKSKIATRDMRLAIMLNGSEYVIIIFFIPIPLNFLILHITFQKKKYFPNVSISK